MADKSQIHGKVARILNSRELALNIGRIHGVEVGMKFDVLDAKGEDVRDPDTGEVLGSLERPKVRVEVTRVQDQLSVASTYRFKKVNVGGVGPDATSLSAIGRVLMPPKWVKKYETLKTDEATWEDLEESESFVKTGDPVVQVLDDGDDETMRISHIEGRQAEGN